MQELEKKKKRTGTVYDKNKQALSVPLERSPSTHTYTLHEQVRSRLRSPTHDLLRGQRSFPWKLQRIQCECACTYSAGGPPTLPPQLLCVSALLITGQGSEKLQDLTKGAREQSYSFNLSIPASWLFFTLFLAANFPDRLRSCSWLYLAQIS